MAPSNPVEDQQSFVMSSGARCGDYWDERLRGFVSLFVLFFFSPGGVEYLIFDLPVKASGCTEREEKMNMGTSQFWYFSHDPPPGSHSTV